MRIKTLYHLQRFLLLAIGAASTFSPVQAQSKVGTTAAQFLGIAVGPRAIAMGGAYVASSEDVTSLFWNPGAVSQSTHSEFVFSNSEWLVGSKFRWFGFMVNFDGANSVGVSLTQLDYGEEEVTTVDAPDGNGQRWSANDLAIGLTYSRRLTDRFSIGGTAKYVSQRIWNESASSMTFDLGLLFVTDFNNMRLGMSMSNFGGDMTLDGKDLYQRIDIDPAHSGSNKTLVGKLKTDPWPMPLLFRVGTAMDVVKNEDITLTVAVDALRPNDNNTSINIGGEVVWMNMLSLRSGYASVLTDGGGYAQSTNQQGISFGAGFRYSLEGLGALEVDYAMNKFGYFGNLNTIAVSIRF
ncbi:MAG: PorV/PorQ family protein [Ignavibacteriae bacterium]|nr:MAG: PorV/PorQ family protein [Ignavibacteriota bacterium]